MTAIFLRELIVLARRGSFVIAAGGVLGVSALFVVAWPTGLALGPGAALLGQLEILLQFSAATLVTWMTCRCGSRERGDDLVRLAVRSAVPPSRVLAARLVAHVVTVILLACAVLPFLVYARETTTAPAGGIIAALVGFIAAGSIGVVAALAFEHLVRSYPWRWLIAAALTTMMLASLTALGATQYAVGLAAVACVAAFAAVAARADRTCRYLIEDEA